MTPPRRVRLILVVAIIVLLGDVGVLARQSPQSRTRAGTSKPIGVAMTPASSEQAPTTQPVNRRTASPAPAQSRPIPDVGPSAPSTTVKPDAAHKLDLPFEMSVLPGCAPRGGTLVVHVRTKPGAYVAIMARDAGARRVGEPYSGQVDERGEVELALNVDLTAEPGTGFVAAVGTDTRNSHAQRHVPFRIAETTC